MIKKKKKKKKSHKVNNKKIKRKKRIIFCIECFAFILILFTYFIINLISTRNVDKGSKLGNKINNTNSYKTNNNIIFLGEEPDNYLIYNNLTWRIISINQDGSLDIILNGYINILSNKNNNINKYLNDILLSNLNIDELNKVSYCKDKISNISNLKCNKVVTSDYIRLPSIEDIINSLKNDSSYLLEDYNYYLNNFTKEGSYALIDKEISLVDSTNMYAVRPVIRLKNSLKITKGNGTEDNPYIIESINEIGLGSYIKLGEDIWIVNDISGDSIGLTLTNSLPVNKAFGSNNKYDTDSKDNIGYYLNNTYLESLDYKDIILDTKWNLGEYNDNYKNIYKKSITSKIGMLDISSIKLNTSNYYYLLTPTDNKIYIYSKDYLISSTDLENKIVPSIYISKTKITSGRGTYENPFELEEEQ